MICVDLCKGPFSGLLAGSVLDKLHDGVNSEADTILVGDLILVVLAIDSSMSTQMVEPDR